MRWLTVEVLRRHRIKDHRAGVGTRLDGQGVGVEGEGFTYLVALLISTWNIHRRGRSCTLR